MFVYKPYEKIKFRFVSISVKKSCGIIWQSEQKYKEVIQVSALNYVLQ